MDPTLMWTLVALGIVALGAVVWIGLSRRRTSRLRERFGPEYQRTVRAEGDVRKAESALEARARRVARLNIRPLSPEDAARFGTAWREVQTQFVDDPNGAVTQADRLVGEVMTIRGYPIGEFEQRVADISVDHPDVVMNYRAARQIALQHSRGEATTEDLRQAMVHYRALFHVLLESVDARKDEPVREVTRSHR